MHFVPLVFVLEELLLLCEEPNFPFVITVGTTVGDDVEADDNGLSVGTVTLLVIVGVPIVIFVAFGVDIPLPRPYRKPLK
ncbi:4169_t:CDS:2 [Acaulospora morrowiae]|uniref:4169_t:CDS:1 n=1 Tax=Acaulospora morrowiae TaxID=94023 RepID=A0A9N9FIV5_9GLOM|nr:4169_t:CDS:2 [Acaulospora morrowiae]